MKYLKISTIITNYNYGKYINECIKSVINQNYQNFEIIIIDDLSTDNSLANIKKYKLKNLYLIKNKKNLGQLASINKGFMKSNGDIITFLDADDYYNGNYFDNLNYFYNNNPSADFTYCDIKITKKFKIKNNKTLINKFKKEQYNAIRNIFLKETSKTISPTSALTMRKKSFNKIFVNKFYEKFFKLRADDYIYLLAVFFQKNIYKIFDNYINYRVHLNNNFYHQRNNTYLRLKNPERVEQVYTIFKSIIKIKRFQINFKTIKNEILNKEFFRFQDIKIINSRSKIKKKLLISLIMIKSYLQYSKKISQKVCIILLLLINILRLKKIW